MLNYIWRFQRGVLWAIDLAAADPPAPVEPRLPTRFEEVRPASIPALAEAMGQADIETIEQRLAGDRRCFAAWVEGEIASYCWISQGVEEVGEMERTIQLLPGEAYIWDCATLPAYRRQGLYTALLGFMVHHLMDEGLRCLWIGANQENRPSLRAFAKTGFLPVITLTFARLLGLTFYWSASAPDAPDGLVAAARRLFVLNENRPLTIGLRKFSSPHSRNGQRDRSMD